MRLCVVGHSMVHIRQQLFFRAVAAMGHEVLIIAPGQWGDQMTRNQDIPLEQGKCQVQTCRHFGGDDQYKFKLLNLKETIDTFAPEWVYVQQEHDSELAYSIMEMKASADWKMALFTWENLRGPSAPQGQRVLKACDVVICGNGEAEAFVKDYAKRTAIMLQVGLDTEHFAYRPGVERDINVGYVGRIAKEKGVEKLAIVWPTAVFLEWQPWKQLPWSYSRMKVVVNYSQDTNFWKEQAPPYTAIEAMSCGAVAIVSNGGSIPYWLKGGYCEPCEGALCVPQNSLSDLKLGIELGLREWESRGKKGREWVEKHLSVPVMAKKLIEVLNAG